MVFMCASLRQTLISKSSKVVKDKEAWGKAENHLAGLLNKDQMLTIADTDAALKKCESHIQRTTIENKTGLVDTTIDNLEIIVLKAKVAQLESNVAINAGPAVKRKRHDNNKKTEPKAIATYTVCQKTGHNTEVCWFGDENKIRDAELALAKAKDEGEPILKTKRATASERKVLLSVLLHCTKTTVLQPRLLSLRCLCVSVPRPLYLTKCL